MQIRYGFPRTQRTDFRKPDFEHISDKIHIVDEFLHGFTIHTHIRLILTLVPSVSNKCIRDTGFQELRRLQIDREIIVRLKMFLPGVIFCPFVLHHLHDRNGDCC